MAEPNDKCTYEQFQREWLAEMDDARLSSLEKGRLFATKLMTQWLGITTDDDDFVVCDGAGDGGIDVAYLKRKEVDAEQREDNSEEGDIWYLVQSKYGSAFKGRNTIVTEGTKVISTLRGDSQNLSGESLRLCQKLDLFRKQASAADRIVLVFATTSPIAEDDRPALNDIKVIGRERITPNFDVEEVSLLTIWEALDNVESSKLSVPVTGQFAEQYSGLLVGTVSLLDLFEFLRAYQSKTGNLDQLYEKNVRQFLGNRRKINKGIATTLAETPEKFGLYNNGITIVVSGYSTLRPEHTVTINDPYVVNGCQTTRTIWQVLDGKLNAGGTGHDAASEDWKERAARGGVVTKIVRSDELELVNITRYTNSQNAIRERDFIALNTGFQTWAAQMAEEYGIFLEIQRGAIESRRAWEKQHPDSKPFKDYVNAFDLIKVYGAGWLAEPGRAFGKNAPFLPNGAIYERILARHDGEAPFGSRDLYAAYKIKQLADGIGFGRNMVASRRQSRFLFYHVVIRILEEVVRLTPELGQPVVTPSFLTEAVIRLSTPETEEQLELLSNAAITLVDQYLTAGGNNSAHSEVSFTETHNSDMNAFLKAENLGRENHSPLLVQALAIQNAAFNMSNGRERVANALVAG